MSILGIFLSQISFDELAGSLIVCLTLRAALRALTPARLA